MNINKLITKAKESKGGLNRLNLALRIGIPFNKPHSFKVHQLSDHSAETLIPYKRRNLNHLKGIHACALATGSEFASGISLLSNLGSTQYRFILAKIEINYHYQAKKSCFSKAEISPEWLEKNVIAPLKNNDKITVIHEVKTYDTDQNHICTALISWQIKLWSAVKTKL